MTDARPKLSAEQHESGQLVKIKYFAAARERAGESEEQLYTDGPFNLGDLKSALIERYPALEPLTPYLRWAVNQSFVEDDLLTLQSGDEVALIPPISGG